MGITKPMGLRRLSRNAGFLPANHIIRGGKTMKRRMLAILVTIIMLLGTTATAAFASN
jgi:hypothetical protein